MWIVACRWELLLGLGDDCFTKHRCRGQSPTGGRRVSHCETDMLLFAMSCARGLPALCALLDLVLCDLYLGMAAQYFGRGCS